MLSGPIVSNQIAYTIITCIQYPLINASFGVKMLQETGPNLCTSKEADLFPGNVNFQMVPKLSLTSI